jgi:hypothetical protein
MGCLLLPLSYSPWSLHVKHVEVLSNTTAIVASDNTNLIVKNFFRPIMKPVLLTMPWKNIDESSKEKSTKRLLLVTVRFH